MNTAPLLAAFIIVVFLNILYWNVVHPVVLRALLFRIFAKRDLLRNMGISGEVEVASAEYKYLQDFVCKTIAWIPRVSLVEFCVFAAQSKNAQDVALENFHTSAPASLKELKRQVVLDAFRIMLINSPFVATVGGMFGYLSWMADKFPIGKLFQRTEQFVNTIDRYQPA